MKKVAWWKYFFFITIVVIVIGGVVYYFFIGPAERLRDLKSRFGNRVWQGTYSTHFKDMSPGIMVDIPTTVEVTNLHLDFDSPEMAKFLRGIVTNAVPVSGDGVFNSGPRLEGGVAGTVTNDPIKYQIEGYLDVKNQAIYLGVNPTTDYEVITHLIIPGPPPWEWDVSESLREVAPAGSVPVKITGDWQTITFNKTSATKTITGSLTSTP